MRRFAELFEALDTTTATGLKVAAMVSYFRAAPPADAVWALYILSGRRPRRLIGPALLRRWLVEESALPEWLVEETYAAVGDLAETIALLVSHDPASGVSPAAATPAAEASLAEWFEERLLPLRGLDEPAQRAAVTGWWRGLPYRESFLVNKLLTGALRVGVSQTLVTRALAEALGVPRAHVEHTLMGEWQPTARFWERLATPGVEAAEPSQPYPFYLASPLEADPATLGARTDWLAEWKWDGIRGQLVRRAGQAFLWSRGEELVSERFPEIVAAAAQHLRDGTVLDGEVLAWRDGRPLPFAQLQQRIGRKKLTPAILAQLPAHFLAYDLLELGGEDLRARPLAERRACLLELLRDAPPAFGVSAALEAADWEALARARAAARGHGVEGLMLKALASPYGSGRQRGAWWKWKIEPWTFDAVMLYAHPGHGRRSNLYTDYTFGVWRDGQLVPVAKAYSGLTDSEIAQLDRWVRAHTTERFGPTRAVEATQVFELAYEGIAASPRHKSGIALRFPRIKRWRHDKPATEADTLEALRAVLEASQSHARSPA
ncbi:MAG: ATP-dependent DNA ligase [Steroidobacteraceae bacterium]|nr:ATP-dependent DNA ligase [Steroidobacteraceae bacterium]